METTFSYHALLSFAVDVGELMLKSGAETYRIEDTILRIISSHDVEQIDVFVTPTGIIVTLVESSSSVITLVRRIKHRSTRLDKVELVNQLSRDYVSRLLTLSEANIRLNEIKHAPSYPKHMLIGVTGLCTTSFTFMFNGTGFDCLLALILGCGIGFFYNYLTNIKLSNYFVLFMITFVMGTLTLVCSWLSNELFNVEPIIIGCIMPFVPGVAFTNALRDTIGDDLLSGISRGLEALFIATALAVGIGVAMGIGLELGGIL